MMCADNQKRIASMRARTHVTPEWKERLRALFNRDLSAKAVGLEVGIDNTAACRWAAALGFRQMYVTAEERRLLVQQRTAKRAA